MISPTPASSSAMPTISVNSTISDDMYATSRPVASAVSVTQRFRAAFEAGLSVSGSILANSGLLVAPSGVSWSGGVPGLARYCPISAYT